MKTVFLLSFLLFSLCSFAQALKLPELNRAVIDEAQFLSDEEKQTLALFISQIKEAGGPQVGILLVPDLQGLAIEDYAIKVAESWKLGTTKKDDGLLIVVSKQEHKVRVEVGQGLEGEITDALADQWIRHIIVPAFKEGRFSIGLAQILGQVAKTYKIDIKNLPQTNRPRQKGLPIHFLILIVIGLFIFLFNRFGGGGRGGPRYYNGGGFYGGMGSGSSFGGGSSSSWGGGGGGFSGGGASGNW